VPDTEHVKFVPGHEQKITTLACEQEDNHTLILSRKEGEKIRIGDDIEVVVVEIRGSQIVIGIKAPVNIAVDREEIYQRKLAEKNGNAKP
jgi:carbon storage regulator